MGINFSLDLKAVHAIRFENELFCLKIQKTYFNLSQSQLFYFENT